MIDAILSRKEFVDSPPVLLDIGASGAIHRKWKYIAKYSIGIAFDADERDMNYVVRESSGYRKLYVYNKVVTDKSYLDAEFYLTRSPHCSSLLRPDLKSLNNWSFAELFEIDKIAKLKTVALPSILQELGIKKVDWFKTDSQGTDLRLFASLGEEFIQRVLAAEFEPGIIDAYVGEDKLWNLLAFMDKLPFWMISLDIRGSERIGINSYHEHLSGLDRKLLPALLKTSPGWGEVAYFNTFERDISYLDKRDFLLGWVFAVIEKQYGFALELALKGFHRFDDPIFDELASFALKKINQGYLGAPFFIAKQIVRRLIRMVL